MNVLRDSDNHDKCLLKRDHSVRCIPKPVLSHTFGITVMDGPLGTDSIVCQQTDLRKSVTAGGVARICSAAVVHSIAPLAGGSSLGVGLLRL
jgi:hypothetical protein